MSKLVSDIFYNDIFVAAINSLYPPKFDIKEFFELDGSNIYFIIKGELTEPLELIVRWKNETNYFQE